MKIIVVFNVMIENEYIHESKLFRINNNTNLMIYINTILGL